MPKVKACSGSETSQGLTCAKAPRKVSMQSNIPISKVSSAENNKMKPCEGCSKVKKHSPIVGKSEFILSMVNVTNCSAQTDPKTEKIRITVKAAEKNIWESRILGGKKWRKCSKEERTAHSHFGKGNYTNEYNEQR